MATEITYDEYLRQLEKSIANLRSSLSDLEANYKLFKEHPTLFAEFRRLNHTYFGS